MRHRPFKVCVFTVLRRNEYLRRVGEVKDFTIIRLDDEPRLSLRIQEYGYNSFIVEVNEHLENDSASFKIPSA